MAEPNAHWRATPESGESERRAQIRNIVVEHVDAENAADMPRVLATYAEACVFDDVPTKTLLRGKQAIAASYQPRFDAYPDMTRTITRMLVDDEGAFVAIAMRGRHDRPYLGLTPTHTVHELEIAAHFAVDDAGLITRETAYYDQLTVMIALGVLPDLSSTRGRTWLMLARPKLILRRLSGALRERLQI